MGLLSGGFKRNFAGSVLECGVRVSTVVSFDEEKPPCRAVQGGAGKHRGESEAYTNLAGGLEVDPPGQRGKAGGNRVWKV